MREMTPAEQIERSLNKRFRKTLWNPLIAAIKRYELIAPGDRIAVCISGGKDSMLMAKLLQMLHLFFSVSLAFRSHFCQSLEKV